MDASFIASVVGAFGGGAIALELVKRALDALGGRGRKRRDEVDRAWRRGDREAQKRRVIEEYASHLRRIMFGAPCIDASEIPPWPTYTSTDTTPAQKENHP